MLYRSSKILTILGLFFLQSLVAQEGPKHVVLITIDGFRPEFYEDSSMPTPNLQEMMGQQTY